MNDRRFAPAGILTTTDFRCRTLPRPSQLVQFPPWGIEVPTPRQTWQVLAIRNPLSTTNVLVPVPLQAEHLVRLIPGFRPVPAHGEQSTTGVTSTVFLVPLHASMNEIPMVASRSDPFTLWERARVPPAKPLPNSCSNRFAWEPSEASKNGLNPPPPNPAKPPPKGFWPSASGSNPGCCDADPYWS